MTFTHLGLIHRSRARRSIAALAFAALAAVTAGCRAGAGALPTLVPTLAIAGPVMETAGPSVTVSPSLTFLFEPVGAVDETPSASGQPTRTITPWPNSSPTKGPSPTPTRTATRTRVPTRTLAPSLTPTITPTPTITYTPTPPAPVHNLIRPGLMSKVVSPIQLEMYVVSGHEGKVHIELIGEDGREIVRQIMDFKRPGRYMWISPEMRFEIEAASEIARLQVSSYDEFNRMLYRSSVDLVLLSVGRSEINPASVVQEPYLIREPDEEDSIPGGRVLLEGLARPVNDSPLIVELINENGQVLVRKEILVEPPSGPLSHTPFTVELVYPVKTSTPVLLVIRQEGSRIPGTIAQTSQVVILEP